MKDQYNQNKQAYEDLGLKIPFTLAQVQKKLTKEQKQAIKDGKGQLVIAPAIAKDFKFADLFRAYKTKYSLWVWEDLWNQYEDDLIAPASVNVIDNTADNKNADPYVQHTNKTIAEQRKIEGQFMNPQEAVILQAILKLDNKNLALRTFIRFPQLPNKTVDGASVVGVGSFGGRLWLGGSLGDARLREGVVLSVGPNLKPQSSSLSLSFEQITDHLLDKGHSVNKQLVEDVLELFGEGK